MQAITQSPSTQPGQAAASADDGSTGPQAPGGSTRVTHAVTINSAPTTIGATVVFDSDTGASATDLVTRDPLQSITGSVNAPIQTGEKVEVSLDNGVNWFTATTAVNSTAWALPAPVLLNGSNTLQVRVTDTAGNSGPVESWDYTLDLVAPSVHITSDVTRLKAGESATLSFTFSEAPQGFTAGDLTSSGLDITDLLVSANPLVYTATAKPLANYTGSGTVTIPAGSYTDLAGNAGTASGATIASIDAQPPSLVISRSAGALKTGETALITFTFNEEPVGFAVEDVAVSGGTLSDFTATANALVYTAVFTPTPGLASGTAAVSVAPGAYSDLAGNPGLDAAMTGISIDTLAPLSAAVGRPRFSNDTGVSSTDLVTSNPSQVVSGDLSMPLDSGDTVKVSFDDGANWLTATTVGTSWSVSQMLTGSGVLRVRVEDSAGNHSPETATPYSLDQSSPTVTITSDVAVANGVTPAIITFTFSEAPVGFSASGITFAGGTLTALAATSNPLVYVATFTPTAGVAAGSATIAVSGTYTDQAGNSGSAGAIPSLGIDTLPPTAIANGGVLFSNDSGALPDDLITNNPSQTVSGTLSAPLAAGDRVQLSLDGGVNWQFAAVSGTSWELTGLTLQGNSSLKVRVIDAAGNFSLPYSTPYTIDTTAPTVTIASSTTGTVGASTTLTFTLSDPGVLTLADIAVTGGTLGHFSGGGTSYTATLTPPANSTTPITVSVGGSLFTDAAGNDNAPGTLVLNVNTYPPDTGGETPAPTTVDGVPVTTAPGPNGATVVTIPVVLPNRPDTSGTPLADIPLVKGADGHAIVSVSVPAGVGLTAEGLATSTTGAAALAELGFRIERITGPNTELTNAGNTFYATLAPGDRLNVQIIKPTLGAGYDGSQPLVINGSTNPADGKQAVIIDARALPSGTVIQVDNIEFIAVVGDVRLIGGTGQNMASGDAGAQWIVLGPGDDILHGGAGNDVVGSEGGDDQVFGDAGDDIVFGGAGNDILSGGAGSDRLNGGTGFDVALQEGKRTDYTITLDGAGIKLTHIASGVSDWLVDVEQVRFETGPILTVAHSAAEEAAAFLFQKWLGRDLSQAEGAAIQTLAGQSAEQVAALFSQLFPTQAAGKTAVQLLDGMASAGAIRVDAVRDVIVSGDAGNNTITLGLARYVDGGAGIDTVVLPATLAQTHIQHNANGSTTLQRMTDGAMLEVANVERVNFSDTKLALDLNGHAGQAAKLLGVLGGSTLLANKGLVGEAIRALDAGVGAQSLAGIGLQALGAQTPAQVVQVLWTSLMGRAGTQAELQPFIDLMATGITGGELAVLAGDLAANAARIDLVGLAAKGIEFA